MNRTRPAAFLDRDGTLIVEAHYLADPDRVELVPGAVDAIRTLRAAGFVVIVVTNQSGIARGLYSEDDFHAVQRRLTELLEDAGAPVDDVYYCPHHPDYSGPCDCRKPQLGLYRRAAEKHGLDLARSVYVGDRAKDVTPALETGGTGYLVRTGYGAEEAAKVPPAVTVVADVAEAARRVAGVDTA